LLEFSAIDQAAKVYWDKAGFLKSAGLVFVLRQGRHLRIE
jgi:hypothetical protein